jgi:hypothetical protein
MEYTARFGVALGQEAANADQLIRFLEPERNAGAVKPGRLDVKQAKAKKGNPARKVLSR